MTAWRRSPGQWFRERTAEEGEGYTIASRRGLAATAIFIVLATTAAVAPAIVFRGSWWSFASGFAAFAGALGLFVLVVVKRSRSR